jgi:hypothetical protein
LTAPLVSVRVVQPATSSLTSFHVVVRPNWSVRDPEPSWQLVLTVPSL